MSEYHDIGRLLSEAIFVMIADNNSTSSTSTYHPEGTRVYYLTTSPYWIGQKRHLTIQY
ncbi:MAG: hypothetical protein WAQ29_07450 [Nitrososphaeraceae archaeon]